MARPTTPHAAPMPAFAPVDSPELIFSTGPFESDVLLGELDEAVDNAEGEPVILEEEPVAVEEELVVVVPGGLEDVVVFSKVEAETPAVPIVMISVLKST